MNGHRTAGDQPTEQEIMKALASIGGRLWQKHGKTRTYLNSLTTLYGLQVTRRSTGKIASATLDGESIGNTQAKRIISRMAGGKLWYDHDRGEWQTSGVNDDDAGWLIKEAQARLDAALTK